MSDTFKAKIQYGTCDTKILGTGEVQVGWTRNPMGRITEGILKSVGFLYESQEAAETGKGKSATAFVVSFPSEGARKAGLANSHPMGMNHAYVVTASHVVNEGYRFLRIAQTNGKVEALGLPSLVRNPDYDPPAHDAWIWHNEGNDVVVYPLPFPNRLYESIHIESFATTANQWGEVVPRVQIDVGDEVFMPGRFLDLECEEPPVVVRFGRISAANPMPISAKGILGDQFSYIAELRTESGYSGAPVLLTKPSILPKADAESVTLADRVWLLGINWGHLPHYEHLERIGGKERKYERSKDWHTHSNAGFANILAAAKLHEVLQYDELKQRRTDEWEAFEKATVLGNQE